MTLRASSQILTLAHLFSLFCVCPLGFSQLRTITCAISPSKSMDDIFDDLDNEAPCIFILSTGADLMSIVLRFARVTKRAGVGSGASYTTEK